jgi:hypothetical protein
MASQGGVIFFGCNPFGKFCCGWPEEEIHAHQRNLSSATSFNFVYLMLTLPLNAAKPIILNSNSTVVSLINFNYF